MTAKAGDREQVADAIGRMPLVDHHVHGMLADPLAEPDLLDAMVQAEHADRAAVFDSQFGMAVRRWCAPALGLEPFADAADYLAARAELGFDGATARLLRASGIATYLIDDGHAPERLLGDAQDVEEVGNLQPGIAVDEMQHPVMRPSEPERLQLMVGIADEVAVGEEQELDDIPAQLARPGGAGGAFRAPRIGLGGWPLEIYVSHIDISSVQCYKTAVRDETLRRFACDSV